MDSGLPQKVSNLMRDGVVTEVDHAAARCRVRSGEMQTGWQFISNNWYYLAKDTGIMYSSGWHAGAVFL